MSGGRGRPPREGGPLVRTKVHLDVAGRARCGKGSRSGGDLTADKDAVTCRSCSAELAPCPSTGAYQRHKKHGEEPCDPCVEAASAYARQCRQAIAELRERR